MSNTTATLNNGLEIPLVGLGTWKSTPGQVKDAVYHAISVGYRHIDGAWIYENQGEVGEGIAKAIAEGLVKREDLWVTSKLWNSFHAKEDVEAHLRDTLSQLKLDYVDLYLIHWPVTQIVAEELTPSTRETWLAMEEMVQKGLTRSIGVSNFSLKKLKDMKEYATIYPAVNQVELHPMLRQDALIAGCAALGVHVSAYAPLGSPDSASMISHQGAAVLKHDVVNKIALETGKSAGQVLIRWALQHGTSVLPKTVTPSRIIENFDVYNWALSDEQYSALSTIEPQMRMFAGRFWLKEGGPYKNVAQLWDEDE